MVADLPVELQSAILSLLPLHDLANVWRTCKALYNLRADYFRQSQTAESILLRWVLPKDVNESISAYSLRLNRTDKMLREIASVVHLSMEEHEPFLMGFLSLDRAEHQTRERHRRQRMIRGAWLLHGFVCRVLSGNSECLCELSVVDIRILDKYTRSLCATIHERLTILAQTEQTSQKADELIYRGLENVHAILVLSSLTTEATSLNTVIATEPLVSIVHKELLARLETPHIQRALRELPSLHEFALPEWPRLDSLCLATIQKKIDFDRSDSLTFWSDFYPVFSRA